MYLQTTAAANCCGRSVFIYGSFVFLHLLKPLNIRHEQSCAADLDFLVLSLLGAGLAVAVYQFNRMGELVVFNADEQSHVAVAQESAGGRNLRE